MPIIIKKQWQDKNLKKTSIILLTAMLLFHYKSDAYCGINDTPLFDYTVQNNNLPYGEYVLIRAWRNVTQLLISKDNNTLLLYTDRGNMKEDKINGTGFSRVNSVILDAAPLSRGEFNHIVESFILWGDSREFSTSTYRGLDYFINNVSEDFILYSKENTEHKLRLVNNEKKILASVNFDPFWKSLSLIEKNNGADDTLHHILIKNSYNRSIKKIIRKYSSLLSQKQKSREQNQ